MVKVSRLYLLLMAMAAVFTMAACHPTDPDEPDNGGGGQVTPVPPTPEVVVINGTTIQSGNNAYGLISDSKTGKGIPDVPVSDGYNFTTTDANGVYQFSANRLARKIFYTTPADYKIALNATTGLPQFFNEGTFVASKATRYDFKLEPLPAKETKYTMIMIGDPQCKTDSDVNRWKNETIKDLHATADGMTNVYAMTLGDITFDNPVQWDAMDNSMRNFKLANGSIMPFFNCIGNHDHDAGKSEFYYAQENFINHLGPVDYSFDRNGLPLSSREGHGIGLRSVLNTVRRYSGSMNVRAEGSVFSVEILLYTEGTGQDSAPAAGMA